MEGVAGEEGGVAREEVGGGGEYNKIKQIMSD